MYKINTVNHTGSFIKKVIFLTHEVLLLNIKKKKVLATIIANLN